MKKRSRGRPKGSTKNSSGEPHNSNFWLTVLSNEEERNMFLKRASKERLLEMADTIKYLKRTDENFFEKINGQEILNKICN